MEVKNALRKILKNAEYLGVLEEWRGKVEEPVLKRHLEIIYRDFFQGKTSSEEIDSLSESIRKELYEFRPLVNGKRITLSEQTHILKYCEDPERRKEAFLADKELHDAVAERVKKLIKLRNEKAQKLGYKNYPDLKLEMQDVKYNDLKSILSQIVNAKEIYESFIKQCASVLKTDTIHLWDKSYASQKILYPDEHFFSKDNILDVVFSTLSELGFQKECDTIKVHNTEIPHGGGGMCFPGKLPDQVHILYQPTDGHWFYHVLFHESTHAIQFLNSTHTIPSLRLDSFYGIIEGIAETIAGLGKDPQWLRDKIKMPQNKIPDFIKTKEMKIATFTFSHLKGALKEFSMYENPDGDFDMMCKKIHQDFGDFFPDDYSPQWAGNTMLVSHPVYRQNYVIAEIIASHLWQDMTKKLGNIYKNPNVGEYLRSNFFKPGNEIPWLDKIEKATKSKLNTKGFVEMLGY